MDLEKLFSEICESKMAGFEMDKFKKAHGKLLECIMDLAGRCFIAGINIQPDVTHPKWVEKRLNEKN
jgi:hypothetical protein